MTFDFSSPFAPRTLWSQAPDGVFVRKEEGHAVADSAIDETDRMNRRRLKLAGQLSVVTELLDELAISLGAWRDLLTDREDTSPRDQLGKTSAALESCSNTLKDVRCDVRLNATRIAP